MTDRMKGTVMLGIAVALASSLCAAVATRLEASVTERSRARAQELVEAGLEALGAPPSPTEASIITLVADGVYSPTVEGQGWRAGERLELPTSETVVFDLEGERIAVDTEARRNDQSLRRRRVVLDGAEGRLTDLSNGGFIVELAPDAVRANRRTEERKLPRLLLREALDRVATLRSGPRGNFAGRPHHVVFFTDSMDRGLTLFFDPETMLLTGYQQLVSSPLYGESVREVEFPAYRTFPEAAGLQVPTGRVVRIAGEIAEEVQYTRVGFGDASQERFEIPAPRRVLDASWRGEELWVHWLDEGVALIRDVARLNVLVVELDDGLLMVEAPRNPGLVLRALEVVRAEISKESVLYAVLTHHHADHSGGVRAYAEAGATIVTTPGNREILETLATAPDAPAGVQSTLRIETVDGRRVLGRGDRTVELIDIGPTPHVEEALVVYLPSQRILFQGDQFIRYSFQGVPAPDGLDGNYAPTKRFFAEKILASDLEVERILGTHNDEILTPRHLEAFLAGIEHEQGQDEGRGAQR